MVERDLFPISQDHQVGIVRVVAAVQQIEVHALIDAPAADGIELVAHLNTLLGEGAAWLDLGDLCGLHRVAGEAVEQGHHEKAGQQIHERARAEDNQALPPLGVDKGAGILALAVLPLHGAVAANGDQAEGILGLLPLPAEESRTHVDGKLVDPHAGELCGQEVAQLMNENQKAENQNGQDNIQNCQQIIITSQ